MSRAWGTTAFFVAAMIAGAVPLWPVYQSPRLVVVVLGAVVGGSLIAFAGFRFRWPGFVVLLATVGFWLATGVALALPEQALGGVFPTTGGLLSLVQASVLGWKQLVTISLPVGTYQALLVPALVLVLVPTVLGLSVALRSRRQAWGFVAPAAVMVIGIALGDARSYLPQVTAPGIVVVALAWYLWRHRARDKRPPRRLLGGALVIALSIGASVAIVGAAAPEANSRAVVRDVVAQPFEAQDYPSPLSAYRAYLAPERSDDLLLEVTGLPAGARLSIARLNSYDGVVAGLGEAVFQRVPFTIDQTSSAGVPVELGVRVNAYRGVWIPGVGPLTSVEFTGSRAGANADGFYYDQVSDTMAVTTAGIGQGDSYRLRAVLPRMVSGSLVAELDPGVGPRFAATAVPPELEHFLTTAAPEAARPGVRLAAALAGLASSGYVSHGIKEGEPFSRSGHGADRLAQLFTAVPMLGDSEQYAVAAALLADRLGFPARVVVGFAPGAGTAESTPVRGSDISAWFEVFTSDRGWVGIDPTPVIRPIPDAVPEEAAAPNRPPVVLPPAPEAVPDTAASIPLANQDDQATPQPDAFWRIVAMVLGLTGLSLAVLALLFGPFVAVVVAKARRTRRRRALGDGRVRARSAWQEYLDASADGGRSMVRSRTRLETAEMIGGPALLVFATDSDRACLSPQPPSEADVDRLWRMSDSLRRELFLALGTRARLRARVSPHTLPAYHYWQRFRKWIRQTRDVRPRRFLPGSGSTAADGQSGARRR
jgi:hypothetical protein